MAVLQHMIPNNLNQTQWMVFQTWNMISFKNTPTTEDRSAEKSEWSCRLNMRVAQYTLQGWWFRNAKKEQNKHKSFLKHRLTSNLYFSFRITSYIGDRNRLINTRRYTSWYTLPHREKLLWEWPITLQWLVIWVEKIIPQTPLLLSLACYNSACGWYVSSLSGHGLPSVGPLSYVLFQLVGLMARILPHYC